MLVADLTEKDAQNVLVHVISVLQPRIERDLWRLDGQVKEVATKTANSRASRRVDKRARRHVQTSIITTPNEERALL
jgi:hypothetical protein